MSLIFAMQQICDNILALKKSFKVRTNLGTAYYPCAGLVDAMLAACTNSTATFPPCIRGVKLYGLCPLAITVRGWKRGNEGVALPADDSLDGQKSFAAHVEAPTILRPLWQMLSGIVALPRLHSLFCGSWWNISPDEKCGMRRIMCSLVQFRLPAVV